MGGGETAGTGFDWRRVRFRMHAMPRDNVVSLAVLASVGALVGVAVSAALGWDAAYMGISGALTGGGLTVRQLGKAPPHVLPPSVFAGVAPVRTNDLLLRPAVPRDAGAIAASIDDVVVEANGMTAEQRRVFEIMAHHPLIVAEAGVLLVCSPDDTLLGVVSFSDFDAASRSAQLGLWIAREARGAGLGAKAITAAAAVAWERGLRSIRLGTKASNVAMLRSFEKAEARFVEVRPHTLPDGSTVSTTWHELAAPP